VTTELPEVSSDETRYSSVVAEQSRVEGLDLCQLWLQCKQKHIYPIEVYVSCLLCEITVEISREKHGQWALQCDR